MNQADWQAVAKLIEDKLDLACDVFEVSPVYGGDINRAWCLNAGDKRFFVKTNQRERLGMFEAEQRGLLIMQQSHSIRVPEVIGCGWTGGHAFIVMEYIDLGGPINEAQFGCQLAAMHRQSNPVFGFEFDNTIGSTAQINTFTEDWVGFWQRYRLGYQLDLAKENRLDKKMIRQGEKLNEQADQFFTDYQPIPSLLHGDLWSGNQSTDEVGNPVIYDPACYFGDHEADLAMMELFGRPSQRFFETYEAVFPIDSGYSTRRDLYNLYHILNHANLFGGGYAASARSIIDHLLSLI